MSYEKSDVALQKYLKPFTEILNSDEVQEISISRPGEMFIDSTSGVERVEDSSLTFSMLRDLSNLVASYRGQGISERKPLLSASLPGGERIQIVLPPACEPETIVFAIRKPAVLDFTLEDYRRLGAFDDVKITDDGVSELDLKLAKLLSERDFEGFMRVAVKGKKNIIVSGGTFTGKTTFTNAIIKEIPDHERIITIEDVQEVRVPHINKVHLLASKGEQGVAKVGVKELLETCLRLRPDRILLSEIRGDEAFYYLRSINSGHPGLSLPYMLTVQPGRLNS
ncbi:MAG: P-type DNA transfer ATPase VirB11 [Flavobacteriales bacterium]|nr:P-type DNA transfer ATPase VirB11 [Flavobacteriales bacterium]